MSEYFEYDVDLLTNPQVQAPTPNVPLFRKVWEHISVHPEEWDQGLWVSPCGTQACVAGWALAFTGHDLKVTVPLSAGGYRQWSKADYVLDGELLDPVTAADTIQSTAAQELGIRNDQAEWLFASTNSYHTVKRGIETIIGEELL